MSDPQNTGQMNGQGELRAVTTAARNFRLRLWLTNQLWITVLGLNMVAVMLSFVLPQLDSWLDRTVPLQSSTVETLFGALAGSMITFTGIVFSALFVAAQIQTSAYSPRLAAQLRRDPVIIGMLVISTMTAAYSLGVLAAVDQSPVGSEAPMTTVVMLRANGALSSEGLSEPRR
mgnify:CR=1 FL=1